MGDRLRCCWDFADLTGTERRLHAVTCADDTERAEVLTQLARVRGLRDEFDAGEDLLDEAVALGGNTGVVGARVALERGRLRRNGGEVEVALQLFADAYASAERIGHEFIAADAAHMIALAAPGRTQRAEWTSRALALAESSEDPEVRYWRGPLLNNLGWDHHAAGDYLAALELFEQALAAREQDPKRPEEIEIARYAVASTLLALDRPERAVPLLERCVAWATERGEPDGWFHEALAAGYDALHRDAQAAEQARLAVPLLLAADPSFAGDTERRTRLAALTGDRLTPPRSS